MKNTLNALWENFLTSGHIRGDIADPDYRRVIYVNAVSFFGSVVALIFSFMHAFLGITNLAVLQLVTACCVIANLISLRRHGKVDLAVNIVLFLIAADFLYLVVDGGLGATGNLWLGVFPFLAFFMSRTTRGAWIWSIGVGATLMLLTLAAESGLFSMAYATASLFTQLMVYLVFTYSASIYDEVRRQGEIAFVGQIGRLRPLAERTQREIQRRYRVEQDMAWANHHDALTALPNRQYFTKRLNDALQNGPAAVLHIDILRLTEIAHALGNNESNNIVREIAFRIGATIEPGDMLARAEEAAFSLFILRPENLEEEAARLAEQLHARLREPFPIANHDVQLVPAIGITVSQAGGDTNADTLRSHALAASRIAAKSEGTHYRFFEESLQREMQEALRIESHLIHALARNEFYLVYQPQVDPVTAQVKGAEALIRWNSPELGRLSPTRFVPIAEATGIIVEIGSWVLREACRQNKAWQDAGLPPIRVAVNLAAPQFASDGIVDEIFGVLKDSGLASEWLGVEITEGTAIRNMERTIGTLAALRELGIETAIDDFGTGFSSLAYLRRFPLNVLKVDREFVKDIVEQDQAQGTHLVDAIITMAHKLGMSVVAEGAETQVQVNYLTDNRADIIQGFFYAQPMTADKFADFLRTSNVAAAAPDA